MEQFEIKLFHIYRKRMYIFKYIMQHVSIRFVQFKCYHKLFIVTLNDKITVGPTLDLKQSDIKHIGLSYLTKLQLHNFSFL